MKQNKYGKSSQVFYVLASNWSAKCTGRWFLEKFFGEGDTWSSFTKDITRAMMFKTRAEARAKKTSATVVKKCVTCLVDELK